jgi:hypothetical protein
MEKITLYPKITVFRNALSDPNKIMDLLKKSESFTEDNYLFKPWEDWYGFGGFMNLPMINNSDPMLLDEINTYFLDQKNFLDEVARLYYQCKEEYVKEWDFSLPNWHINGISICKYNPSDHKRYAMKFHTDYN